MRITRFWYFQTQSLESLSADSIRMSLKWRIGCRRRLAGFRTGSGQKGFLQKGHKSLTLCYILPQLATCCNNMFQHFAHVSQWKSIMGNCGTSATIPFVLTPSGSCQTLSPSSSAASAHLVPLLPPACGLCNPMGLTRADSQHGYGSGFLVVRVPPWRWECGCTPFDGLHGPLVRFA